MPVPEGERQMAQALHDARTEVVALRESLSRAEEALEQWPPVARALVTGRPVRNLDELIVATERALASSRPPKEEKA